MKIVSFVTAALAGASSLALYAGPALAQPSTDTTDWNGPYVGLNAGWNSSNTTALPSSVTSNQLTGLSNGAATVTVPPATFPTARMDYSTQGFAGGGQVGFNHQMGHLVLGLEGDMDGTGGRSSQFSSYALPATGLTTGSTVTILRRTDPDWTATVRGRVGYATGRMLFYGTGGLAIADARQSALYGYAPTPAAGIAAANPGAALGPFSNGGADDRVLTGWTVGGGAEFALNRAVSVGAEYRHSDYGHDSYSFGGGGAGATGETLPINLTDDQVLAKVNFRFGNGLGIFH
ncbi:MAG TPA: outer membrane beta-barrel protein [Caulobacteraceae bacterium]